MPKTQKPASESSDIEERLLDELMTGSKFGDEAGLSTLMNRLKKGLIERMLGAELSVHLGYEKGQKEAPESTANCRNGSSKKTLLSEEGPLEIEIPRDRLGEFAPQLIKKGQRRFEGFDEKILAMYARGMSVREIQAFLREQYNVDVSPDLISAATDAVMEEVTLWQNRPLEALYPLVIFDALRVKIRDEGTVKNKAVYLALGVGCDGQREILGLWIEQTEGAKFWLRVMSELKNRGVNDMLIAVVDGLKGFPEAIESVFPQAEVQTCVVHLIRNSLEYCGWKDRKEVAAALRSIYRAESVPMAAAMLEAFAAGPWGQKYPTIAAAWRRQWERFIPFLAYPLEVRTIIYTTNAIESVNMRLRKIIKTRGHFPSDAAATKLLFLALRNIATQWKNAPIAWKAAMNQFAIRYQDRFPNQLS